MAQFAPDFLNRPLTEIDPEIAAVLADEVGRQQQTLEMIASENFVPEAILECQGSVLTNKYAEGYPGKRYYGGCEFVDVAEQLGIDRAKELFGADHANLQPHSGASANSAVYHALLQPGDTLMGLALAHGGHLSHGMKINMSGRLYDIAAYEVSPDDYLIDMDAVAELARERKPKMIIAGWSAYPRYLDFERFREIADEVGALLLVDMAHFAGLVAGGVHPSPVPYADVVTTTVHKTLGGPRGGMILCREEHAKAIDSGVFPGQQGGPLMHVIAGKAVAFKEALEPEFKDYQVQVVKNAQAMAKAIMARGYKIVSGGTENHLMLIDMIGREITGKDAEAALGKAHITVNKNSVPNDPRSPFVTSGLRIGTPALTTRGYKEPDCVALANWICDVLDDHTNEAVLEGVRDNVTKQCRMFPVYE
jgi:glycine hydroxymethyltransferase